MRPIHWVGILFILVMLTLMGCVTSKVNTHGNDFDYADITPGKIVYHFVDKSTMEETFPREATLKLKDGHFNHSEAGFSYYCEVGWDLFGLQPRPMVMIRPVYLWSFGIALGADENAALFSVDWRYKDFLIGPCLGIPWDNPSKQIYGGKIAIEFQP